MGQGLRKERKARPKNVARVAGVTSVALEVRSSEWEARDTARQDPKSFESHWLILSVLIRTVL